MLLLPQMVLRNLGIELRICGTAFDYLECWFLATVEVGLIFAKSFKAKFKLGNTIFSRNGNIDLNNNTGFFL